jgi:hypothetical protein
LGETDERAEKGNQDMGAKCGRFAEWLGYDDMARVGFENCRDYRDAMIDKAICHRALS